MGRFRALGVALFLCTLEVASPFALGNESTHAVLTFPKVRVETFGRDGFDEPALIYADIEKTQEGIDVNLMSTVLEFGYVNASEPIIPLRDRLALGKFVNEILSYRFEKEIESAQTLLSSTPNELRMVEMPGIEFIQQVPFWVRPREGKARPGKFESLVFRMRSENKVEEVFARFMISEGGPGSVRSELIPLTNVERNHRYSNPWRESAKSADRFALSHAGRDAFTNAGFDRYVEVMYADAEARIGHTFFLDYPKRQSLQTSLPKSNCSLAVATAISSAALWGLLELFR